MYRVNLTRLDVEFRDTGSGHYVSFYRTKVYYFQPNMSAYDDTSTFLTNLNPAYLAAVATAANQERLINVALCTAERPALLRHNPETHPSCPWVYSTGPKQRRRQLAMG